MKRFARVFPDSLAIVAFDGRKLMGWALAFEHESTVLLNLFVYPRYRTSGVATGLVQNALKEFPVITLAEWNEETRRFFRGLRKKFPEKIAICNWSRRREKYSGFIEAVEKH